MLSDDVVDSLFIASLPPALTHLELSLAKRHASDCFQYLPKGLTELTMRVAHNIEDRHIAMLPRQLRTMAAHNAVFKLTTAAAALFPQNLESLTPNDTQFTAYKREIDTTPLSTPDPRILAARLSK